MDLKQKEQFLQEEYARLKQYKHKKNAQILFNIISAKKKFGMPDYNNTLYLDVKHFVKSYITAVDNLDYGYDEIRLDKINDVCESLGKREQLSIYYTVRRLFHIRGYDIECISSRITTLEWQIAFKEHRYFKCLRLLIGSNVYALILAYLLYAVIIFLIIHPAPIKFMEVFTVELKEYSDSTALNYLLNSLAILTGNDSIRPVISPIGFIGMISYCIGIIIFYVLIANFLFKKIEDFITLKLK